MCPKGTNKNNEQVYKFIRSGAATNTHGSGIMYKKNGIDKVFIKKGFKNADEVIEELKKLDLKEEDELAIHHRIGTSGAQNNFNTHPFVISNEDNDRFVLDAELNKACLMHNGHFNIRKYQALNREMSDTYAFSRYIIGDPNMLNLLRTNKDLFLDLTEDITDGDKICIFFPDRPYELLGKFIEQDGYFHSNYGFNRHVWDRGGSSSNDDRFSTSLNDMLIDAETELDEEPDFKEIRGNGFKLLVPNNTDNTNKNSCCVQVKSKIRELKDLVVLDNSSIVLNETNIDHFWYIRKLEFNELTKEYSKHRLFSVRNFDSNVELQTIFYAHSVSNVTYTVITNTLINGCFYIPKGPYFQTIYSDYITLYGKSIKPSKNMIKNLEKLLNKNFKKSAVEDINYKVAKGSFCKMALQFHLQDLKDSFKPNAIIKALNFSD